MKIYLLKDLVKELPKNKLIKLLDIENIIGDLYATYNEVDKEIKNNKQQLKELEQKQQSTVDYWQALLEFWEEVRHTRT